MKVLVIRWNLPDMTVSLHSFDWKLSDSWLLWCFTSYVFPLCHSLINVYFLSTLLSYGRSQVPESARRLVGSPTAEVHLVVFWVYINMHSHISNNLTSYFSLLHTIMYFEYWSVSLQQLHCELGANVRYFLALRLTVFLKRDWLFILFL